MLKPLLTTICLMVLWSLTVSAYTLVLKDGRRMEVQGNYRLVNDVAIFTLQDGRRMSISVRSIDVSATELSNQQEAGDFVRQAGSPLPISNSDQPNPGQPSRSLKDGEVARSKPRITRKLTNVDFEQFRQRREEKDETGSTIPLGTAALAEAMPPPRPFSPVDERKTELYWRDRSRQILTEISVYEELVGVLQKQLSEMEANSRRPGTGYTTIYTPGSIGVGRGGGYYNPGTAVVLPQQNRTLEQDQELKIRERLMDSQLQLSAAQVRYAALQEEARKADVPPGWVR